jgi:hypothetical protein
MNKSGVRAADDAMSLREEAAPALAALMTCTQRCRVTSSAAARHTSLAPCNVQRYTRVCAEARSFTWLLAGNLISKANACPSTAALHGMARHPARERNQVTRIEGL